MEPEHVEAFVYDVALERLALNEPVGMVPTCGSVWITAINPIPVSSPEDCVLLAIAMCARARKEAAKYGYPPV